MHPTSRRLFSSSSTLSRHAPAYVSSKTYTVPAEKVPGRQFKRGQEGLFGNARVLSGNNVPHSLHKTRRKWFPNVQNKSLFSETLGAMVRVRLTSRVLRSVDKMGGFDRYIQNTSASELGDEGLKWRIILEQYKENQQRRKFSSLEHPVSVSTSQAQAQTRSTTLPSYPNLTSSNVDGRKAEEVEEVSAVEVNEKDAASPSDTVQDNSQTQEKTTTTEETPSIRSIFSALPEPPPPQTTTPVNPSEETGLLFAREFRKRSEDSPPRIPVFSKALQRSMVRQNVNESINTARAGKQVMRMSGRMGTGSKMGERLVVT